MADSVLERLRDDRSAPPDLPDLDALWVAGRRRRRGKRILGLTAGSVAVTLVGVALVLPGMRHLGSPSQVPSIAAAPDGKADGGPDELALGHRVLWDAPPALTAVDAGRLFVERMQPGWGDHSILALDVEDGETQTVVSAQVGDDVAIDLHLFREVDAPDRWYVVAVDSGEAPLTRDVGGRPVLTVDPIPSGAVTVTVDRRTAAGTVTLTVPIGELARVLVEQVTDGDRSMLLRYRDLDGRLIAARGASFTGPWADVVAARPGLGGVPISDDDQGEPELRFGRDALWTSPPAPDVDEASRTFALHAFGWAESQVTNGDGDVTRTIRVAPTVGEDAAVTVRLVAGPVGSDVWHVIEVGDGVLTIDDDNILRFAPVPPNAVTADVLAGSDRTHFERDVDVSEVVVGEAQLPGDSRVEEFVGALVRFRDADGVLVGAIGHSRDVGPSWQR